MKKNDTDIIRYNPDVNVGLATNEVEERKNKEQVHKTRPVYGKSIFKIILNNLLSPFFIVCYVVVAALIVAGGWKYLLFVLMILPASCVGFYSDIETRINVKKDFKKEERVIVLRDGIEQEISENELVPDDIIVVKPGSKINVDAIVVFGTVSVSESLITGISENIQKGVEDNIYSGSTITSGYAKIQVVSVKDDTRRETIKNNINKAKRPTPYIISTVENIFSVSILFALLISLCLLIINIFINKLTTNDVLLTFLDDMTNKFAFITPVGLMSFALLNALFSSIRLKRKNIKVQDIRTIEMISKSDIICLDKTGTITDASLRVKNVEPLGSMSLDQISQVLSNLINATKDSNATAEAIKKYIKYEPTLNATASLPFTSENKYSGASFGTKGTFIMGAIEHLNLSNKSGFIYRADEFISKGYRVLMLGRSMTPITGSNFKSSLEPIALIVIEDSIRLELIDTFKQLKELGKEIKIISGDNAKTVGELAKSLGVPNASKCVSLEGKSDKEVKSLAKKYFVFGRATAGQKALIIESLKKDGKTVTMVGDGINDVLALKQANCSISIESGCEEAKGIANIVLEESGLVKLPEIVDEGTSVLSNIQKIASLYIVKTLFVISTMIMYIITSLFDKQVTYPFNIQQFYVWEIAGIIVPSTFLSIQKGLRYHIKKWVLSMVMPAFIIQLIFAAMYMVLYFMRKSGNIYLDISLVEYKDTDLAIGQLQLAAMEVVTFTCLSIAVLFRILHANNLYRRIAFAVSIALFILLFGGEILISLLSKGENNFMQAAFNYITPYQWIFTAMIVVVTSAIYLFTNKVVAFIRGRIKENENQN